MPEDDVERVIELANVSLEPPLAVEVTDMEAVGDEGNVNNSDELPILAVSILVVVWLVATVLVADEPGEMSMCPIIVQRCGRLTSNYK